MTFSKFIIMQLYAIVSIIWTYFYQMFITKKRSQGPKCVGPMGECPTQMDKGEHTAPNLSAARRKRSKTDPIWSQNASEMPLVPTLKCSYQTFFSDKEYILKLKIQLYIASVTMQCPNGITDVHNQKNKNRPNCATRREGEAAST
jgi:hypothetical protein